MTGFAGLVEIACNFQVRLKFSSKSEQNVRNGFSRAAIGCGSAQGYLSFSLFAALAAGMFLGAASALVFSD
ncbi:MAG: hypothetical protein WC717_05925, partial [Candidatus Micrarchaeia archaeon]